MKTEISFFNSAEDKVLIGGLALIFLGIAITFIIQILSFPLNLLGVIFRVLLIIFALIAFKCLEATLFYKIKFDPAEKSILFGSTFKQTKIIINNIKNWRIRGWVGGYGGGSLSFPTISKKTYTTFECWLNDGNIFYYSLTGGVDEGEKFFENIIKIKPVESGYFGNPIIFSKAKLPSITERIKYQLQPYGLLM